MNPRKDHSILDIPVPSSHRRVAVNRVIDVDEEGATERPRRRKSRRGRRLFIFLAIVLVVVCAIGGLLLSTLFAGAVVTVYPRSATTSPSLILTARPSAPAGTLAYQTISVTSNATTSVQASGTQKVSRQASGLATIYNTYSTASQRLIANTRFEAPDGKIYRIHDSVVVPGETKTSNGSLSAGTAQITIYADSPGDSYNKGQTRLTIPGFKGDPKYTKFYAQADSISGGFVGTEPAIAPSDLAGAKTAMQQKLSDDANAALSSQTPVGYIFIPASVQLVYTDLKQSVAAGNTANITQGVSAVGVIVKSDDLASAIARQSISGYNGEPVSIANASSITISIASSSQVTTTGPINLAIGGGPVLAWQYDPAALKQALLGQPKSSFESIITSFRPAITRAEAKVRPVWMSKFPSDPAKLIVETEGQN